jgi:hypothetical protein
MKMKPGLILLFSVLMLIYSCDHSPFTKDEMKSGNNNSDTTRPGLRPITIMEGGWSWIKTEGSGIAGPYVQDPAISGYTLFYNFYDFTHLAIYRNNVKEIDYTYHLEASDSISKQTILLTDSLGSSVSYLWNVETVYDEQILELTNPIPCCDNSYTMYFIRISNAQFVGK